MSSRGVADLRLLPAALIAWGATWLALRSEAAAWGVAVGALVIAAAVGAVGYRSDGVRRAICLASVASFGMGAGLAVAVAVRVHDREDASIAGYEGSGSVSVVLQVEEWPKQRSGSVGGHLDASRMVVAGSAVAVEHSGKAAGARASPVRGAVLVVGATVDLATMIPGERVAVRGTVLRSTRPGLVAAVIISTTAPTRIRGAPPHFRVAAAVRRSFADVARRAVPPDAAGLLPALVLGDESETSPVVRDDFADSGLAHLTAVSGANFAIVALCVLSLCAAAGLPLTWRAVCTAVAIVGFVLLVGPTGSVVRAAVMGLLGVAALALRRGRQPFAALLAAIVVLMLVRPALARDIGFLLSVAATAGLIVWAPVMRDQLVRRRCPELIAGLLSVTVVAQMVTLPLVVGLFGSVPIGGLLANLLVGPVIPIITVLGTAAAVIAPIAPGCAELAARATGPALWWLLEVARWCGRIPTLTAPGGPLGQVAAAAVLIGGAGVGYVWQHVRRGRRRASAPGGGIGRPAGRTSSVDRGGGGPLSRGR